MGALKLIPKDCTIVELPENRTNWQELQDDQLKDAQNLCSMLEKKFITAVGSERHSILNLLSIYYNKIQTLCSHRSDFIIVESSLNFDQFVYDKEEEL
jgi:hypothetical protein